MQLGLARRPARVAMVELHGRAPAFASMWCRRPRPDLYEAYVFVRSDALEVLPFGPVALNHDFTQMVKDDFARRAGGAAAVCCCFILVLGRWWRPRCRSWWPARRGGRLRGHRHPRPGHAVSAYANNVVSMIASASPSIIRCSCQSLSRRCVPRDRRRPSPAPWPQRAHVLFSVLTVAIGLLGISAAHGQLINHRHREHHRRRVRGGLQPHAAPALLAILGPRLNALRCDCSRATPATGSARLALRVARPWAVLIPVVAVLLLLGLRPPHPARTPTSRRSLERREPPGQSAPRAVPEATATRSSWSAATRIPPA